MKPVLPTSYWAAFSSLKAAVATHTAEGDSTRPGGAMWAEYTGGGQPIRVAVACGYSA